MQSAPAACLTLLALSLTACHNTKPAPGAPQSTPVNASDSTPPIANPCSLATLDEVSAVMGRRSQPGELHQAFNGNRCNFYDASSQYEVFLQTVDWRLAGPVMTSENTLQGIGERAYWSYGSIYVLKNGHGMMVGFQLPHFLSSPTPPAENFAKQVASRM
jgi:predicted small secreted protein